MIGECGEVGGAFAFTPVKLAGTIDAETVFCYVYDLTQLGTRAVLPQIT